ncbi:hypothetical protein TNCV_3092581 [Trichonephila clavipes]|uniref:Uncharacterized protein n=1 Tax=Trichonephila clavipes TaxID=2585209 RepID=A0A8X6RXD6_TRICX|nr:hypothetical protein TNCV_3092581 [Trichonephila clavipes]
MWYQKEHGQTGPCLEEPIVLERAQIIKEGASVVHRRIQGYSSANHNGWQACADNVVANQIACCYLYFCPFYQIALKSVRRHLDAFTRGRIIGKLEKGRSVTSVAAEFSQHQLEFQTTGTAVRGSVVVVHEESHPQMTGTLSYRPEETGGRKREKSLDTRHRRLDERYRIYRGQKTARWWSVARRPVRCVP